MVARITTEPKSQGRGAHLGGNLHIEVLRCAKAANRQCELGKRDSIFNLKQITVGRWSTKMSIVVHFSCIPIL